MSYSFIMCKQKKTSLASFLLITSFIDILNKLAFFSWFLSRLWWQMHFVDLLATDNYLSFSIVLIKQYINPKQYDSTHTIRRYLLLTYHLFFTDKYQQHASTDLRYYAGYSGCKLNESNRGQFNIKTYQTKRLGHKWNNTKLTSHGIPQIRSCWF